MPLAQVCRHLHHGAYDGRSPSSILKKKSKRLRRPISQNVRLYLSIPAAMLAMSYEIRKMRRVPTWQRLAFLAVRFALSSALFSRQCSNRVAVAWRAPLQRPAKNRLRSMCKTLLTSSLFARTITVVLLMPFLVSLANAQFIAAVGQDPSAAGVASLREMITAAHDPDLRWPDFLFYRSEVEKFYESDGYSLSWIHHGHERAQARVLISLLQAADYRGLNPEDYDGPRWSERLASLQGSVP